jgi:hypothetical protein
MLVHTYNGVDLTDAVETEAETTGFATSAKLGQSESIQVVVDDPEGVRSFTGHKVWLVRETECDAGNQVIWAGYVARKAVTRGSYKTGAGRQWNLSLVEANTYLVRRILRPETTNPKRPSETVSARVAWVLTAPGMSGVVLNDGLVMGSSVLMDEHDYTDQTAADVLRECAIECGYNFFIRYREATEDFELAFVSGTSSLDISTLRVSNDPADVDVDGSGEQTGPTWYANPEASIEQDPERVVSGVSVRYPSGTVYETEPDTATAFAEIDLVSPSGFVKSATAARALGQRLLAQHSTEEEIVTNLVLTVPAANVNDILAGQLMQAKFVHGPNWEAFRSARAPRKVLKRPPNLSEEKYLLELELQPPPEGTVPIFPIASEATLHSPNDNSLPNPGNECPPGTYRIEWDNTKVGCTPAAEGGNVSWVGSPGAYTGMQADGAGSVLIDSKGTVSGVGGGTITFTAYLYKNGTPIADVSQTTTGGIRFLGWTWAFVDEPTDVVDGDIIETWLQVSAECNILVIPAGTGDCANVFAVTGDLG